MDWIKIPIDNILLSENTDKETMVLIKYQALYCQLEKEPTTKQLKRFLKQKDILFLQNYIKTLNELSENQIKTVTKKRGRNKIYYSKNKDLDKIQTADSTTEGQLSDGADKIRLDKKEKIYKKDKFIKPTLQEVKDYISINCFSVDGDYFYKKQETDKWKGIKNWKNTIHSWQRNKDTRDIIYFKKDILLRNSFPELVAWMELNNLTKTYLRKKHHFEENITIKVFKEKLIKLKEQEA